MLCQVPSRNTSCVICSGKYECSILFFLFVVVVVLRVPLAVAIARELGFVPNGWKSLQCHCS
ncbi:hypothetical protein F2Q70_00027860 [Brassica cretica]|uniref:Uncharacterized protein n=1 Tax=Brassica cretica TaxID=69181 RepID=A0A8S9LD10_BRACR|nr:hypothetical protein F2Q70_00027860 [Brassica cretica]